MTINMDVYKEAGVCILRIASAGAFVVAQPSASSMRNTLMCCNNIKLLSQYPNVFTQSLPLSKEAIVVASI